MAVVMLAASLCVSACAGGCPTAPLVDLGEAVRDDDGDNWFTNDTNQRVRLRMESINLPLAGRYTVLVNDVRFPVNASLDGTFEATSAHQVVTPDVVVATENIGTWLLDAPDQAVSFRTLVVVRSQIAGGTDEVPETVVYHNRDETLDVIFRRSAGNDVVIRFRVEVLRFADPTPADAEADPDGDGITEFEESALAMRGVGVGDPAARDLILLVAYTHPDWAMTKLTRELLATRFRQRGIRLRVVTDREDPLGVGFGQRVTFDGATPARDHEITLDEAREARETHVIGTAKNHTHFLVLAEQLADGAWGRADLPGRTLVARSHLPVLGPDVYEYQAKDVMHELGHNLGLCHPTQSGPDDDCPTGAIPAGERDAGLSVMGTPAEEANFIGVIANALARPLDYTPGQWNNLNLALVRP